MNEANETQGREDSRWMRERIAELEWALAEAIEDIEDWAAYADDYFLEKHDLQGCLEKHRAKIDKENSGYPERVEADLAAERERELVEALIRARDALYEAGRPDSKLDRASAIAVADICAAKIDAQEKGEG